MFALEDRFDFEVEGFAVALAFFRYLLKGGDAVVGRTPSYSGEGAGGGGKGADDGENPGNGDFHG